MNKEKILSFLNDPVHNLASFWYVYTKVAKESSKGRMSYSSMDKKRNPNEPNYSFKDDEIDILKIAITNHLKKYSYE